MFNFVTKFAQKHAKGGALRQTKLEINLILVENL